MTRAIGSLFLVAACASTSAPPASEPAPTADPVPAELEPAPASGGYTYSDFGKQEFMTGCLEDAYQAYCQCALDELQKRYPEEYVDSGQMTEEQVKEIANLCQ